MPTYGRNSFAEPPSTLRSIHFHDGTTPLKEVDWEPKVAVLDQEDLLKQGIRTSQLVTGAKDVDALGSCTANTAIEALSNLLAPSDFFTLIEQLAHQYEASYTDTVTAEKAAIVFYNRCTDQSGDPASEWPPTDCGSTGLAVVNLCKTLGVATGAKVAHGSTHIVSLMQTGGVMVGSPFLQAWEEPGPDGFIDGDGKVSTLEAQLQQGVAGGHEYYLSAIEKLVLYPSGHVNARETVGRIRNSWSASWADQGSARVHLSTFDWLGRHADFRQLVA